eukprot:TRINITY_DN251_c0_g1_i6.p1 TRINITY_DN251_c0_g1~~TRINITY_DN251_c0_g1_i6.p1  ORF type:complete len:186 (+),score=24.70 TRINITY_DN251_c0_g1_i6:737-1294(+)
MENFPVDVSAESKEHGYMYLYGSAVKLIGMLITQLGLTLQRYSFSSTNVKSLVMIPYFKQPLWWAGLVLFYIGNLLDAFALLMVSQSLWVILTPLALVFHVVSMRLFLRHFINRRQTSGCLSIIVGCALGIIFTGRDPFLFDVFLVYDILGVAYIQWTLISIGGLTAILSLWAWQHIGLHTEHPV